MILTQVFSKVLNMSLTASLVIVLVIAARFILRKSPKVFSYALWAVVLFRLLCPVSLPSPVSLLGLLDAPVTQSKGITNTVEYIPYKVVEKPVAENPALSQLLQNTTIQLPTHGQQNTIQNPAQSQQTTVPPEKKPISAAEIIAYIWISGIAVMAIVGVGSYLRFRKHLTGAMQVKDNIYLVDHIDSAFVAGLIRPKVYLPSDIPVTQMGYIIAHEQYHIRRLDHVTKHLSFAALCIHWFNPFVWVAFILSGKDLEMSCDEAVIKKLGEDIRADYSASLLSLATGRRIIAGTPLAFGEGDTKGRIKNMAKWKQPKKWVSIGSFILCFAILAACAANPAQEVVISKNDCSFDIKVIQSATESPTQHDTQAETATDPSSETLDYSTILYEDTFSSTDGTVEFTIMIDEGIPNKAMPVIEVSPHYLSEDDAKRVANVLFGDSTFYEAEPLGSEVYSKGEIQEKISRLLNYQGGVGIDEDYFDQARNRFIEEYTIKLETAPVENPHKACQWKFRKLSYYYWTEEELKSIDTSNDNDALQVRVNVNGIPYLYAVSTRNRDDYKINNINVLIDDGPSPLYADKYIFENRMCQTEQPDNSDVRAIEEKAMDLLHQMNLGDWAICNGQIIKRSHNDFPEYQIVVNAVPSFEGVAAVRRPQFTDLTSNEAYSSNYRLTTAQFVFNISGELISFEMTSPIDVTEVINSNVQTLDFFSLMERAKTHFSLSDYYEYDHKSLLSITDEDYNCYVTISEIEYGMTRVKVPNSDERYYYVPAMFFYGSIQFEGKESGTIYDIDLVSDVQSPLLILNAVDGSVINIANG